jgi:hypothetical protein
MIRPISDKAAISKGHPGTSQAILVFLRLASAIASPPLFHHHMPTTTQNASMIEMAICSIRNSLPGEYTYVLEKDQISGG